MLNSKSDFNIDGALTVYGEPIEIGSGLPTGGSTGNFLVKNSSTNYDCSWASVTIPVAHNVPDGGTSNQVLAKNSDTDYDIDWANTEDTITNLTYTTVTSGTPGNVYYTNPPSIAYSYNSTSNLTYKYIYANVPGSQLTISNYRCRNSAGALVTPTNRNYASTATDGLYQHTLIFSSQAVRDSVVYVYFVI